MSEEHSVSPLGNGRQDTFWTPLFLAWLLALVATAGALFLGEVMGKTPCVLCWYQRIAMFPLVLVLGIGLFASTIANTQQEAMLTVWMTLLPSIFLSGFFFPLEAMPRILQWISYFVPLRYYLVIIRSLLLKGVGLEMIRTDVLAMTLFAVGIMTAAALRFRKRLD